MNDLLVLHLENHITTDKMYKKHTSPIDGYTKSVYNYVMVEGGDGVEAKRFDQEVHGCRF